MIMNDFAYKARNGSRRFLTHRVPVPFPLFILKIGLIVGLVALSAVFVVRTVLLTKKLEWQPPPMVLVPGVMGSKLYVETFDVVYPPGDKKYANCSANIPLRKSWVSDQLADQTHCELFLLSLDFQRDGKFHNQRNVKMGANLEGVPFGSSLWPIQCTYTDKQPRLCDYSTFKGMDDSYFRRLGLFLSSQLKYQVGSTLFAAQYDWRHDQQSDEMNTYYEDLRSLVERAVNSTKRKAVLLGHSMGNIVINRFLRNKVSPEWQKTYLQSTINVAAPFGGVVGMLRGLISGKTMELPNNGTIPGRDVAELLRQMGFPANLLPFNNAFGEQNVLKIGDILIKGHQMLDFLLLIKDGLYNPFYEQNEPQPQAHVPMHCVYSISPNNTDSYLEYKSMDDPEPKTTLGDGDGSVNAESLRVCEQWKAQGHPVTIKEFGKFEHSQILMEKDFFAYIADLLISF